MQKRLTVLAAAAMAFGAHAVAHDGAVGVVKERMDGMVTLSEASKEISAMIRGLTPYDAARVQTLAETIAAQSGEAMTARFPEGSASEHSEALPEIWQDWEQFDALAVRQEDLAIALGAAAQIPLAGAAGGPLTGPLPGSDALRQTPPDVLFMTIARGCASCHETYRLEGE